VAEGKETAAKPQAEKKIKERNTAKAEAVIFRFGLRQDKMCFIVCFLIPEKPHGHHSTGEESGVDHFSHAALLYNGEQTAARENIIPADGGFLFRP
jgi:hypothetical protein